MNEDIEATEAARALEEIDRRREQVIRRKVFPAWYWWAHAALMIELVAAIEHGGGVVLGIGLAVFMVGTFILDAPVSRRARAAAPHRGLAGPGAARRTLIGLVSFIAVLLGVALVAGLSLKAAGAPYPGTIAVAVAAALFATGGPMLVRLEATMLLRRSRR
ncbi:hypothetical protein [Kutzneria sp. NPDC051319]|uniref:hypothetical protein n=1 Tax=Kutzneria sp. NPDC051319 TaxID=3155047 RepID=UPI00343CA8DC